MTEHKLFTGSVPHVSTPEYHRDRERAPHLEQPWHQPRLHAAAGFVLDFGSRHLERGSTEPLTVSDLGCGDGGLLSLLRGSPDLGRCWGYDFQPSNQVGWTERGVEAYARDVFGQDWDDVMIGDVVAMTEVLEHLADPHQVLRLLRDRGAARLVCSSPWNEDPGNHSDCHAWAWDKAGYRDLLETNGWNVRQSREVGLFQVVQATAQPVPARDAREIGEQG